MFPPRLEQFVSALSLGVVRVLHFSTTCVDVYKEMRSNPRTRRVPVVIVTGSDARELEPSVGRYFLRKPITADSVVSAVDKAISTRGRGAADAEEQV